MCPCNLGQAEKLMDTMLWKSFCPLPGLFSCFFFSNNRLCHPWQQEPQSGIFDKWQRFFHITVEELCPTFLCRTRHVTVPQSDLSPAFDSATPKPSFHFLSPFRGGLAGVFRIIIMLYIPSALELQAVNCCCGSIDYIKSSWSSKGSV